MRYFKIYLCDLVEFLDLDLILLKITKGFSEINPGTVINMCLSAWANMNIGKKGFGVRFLKDFIGPELLKNSIGLSVCFERVWEYD